MADYEINECTAEVQIARVELELGGLDEIACMAMAAWRNGNVGLQVKAETLLALCFLAEEGLEAEV